MSIIACWSFSLDGLRCDLEGGHPGPHSHAVTWTDDEAWQPQMTKTERPVPILHVGQLPGQVTVEDAIAATENRKCVACNHSVGAHGEGGGECHAAGCDCRAMI